MPGNIQGSITYEIKVATEKAKRELEAFSVEAERAVDSQKLGENDYQFFETPDSSPFVEMADEAEEAKEIIFSGGGEIFGGVEDSLTYLKLELQQAEQNARECALVLQDLANKGASLDSPEVQMYVERLGEAERAAEAIRQKIDGISSGNRNGGVQLEVMANGAKKLTNILKNSGIAKMFNGIARSASNAGHSFLRMSLAMIGARSLFAALRKAVNAYMAENEGLNAKLSGIWSGLGNVLGPVIERIINLLGTAIGYITKFISALGSIAGIALGNSKALNKQAKATGGAGGAAAKASKQLAAFDEMNKLSDNAGGGGGGGGGASAYDWSSEVTLPDWAQMVAENIKKGDWYSAGAILGEKFTEMFTRIDWAMIAQKLSNGIHNLFAIISGFFENTDWLKLGESIATFIANINWKQLVQDIARLAGNIIGASAALVKGLFGNAWKTLSDWFHKNAMDGGKFTIEGLWNGILDAMKNAWQWIKENIFQPFWDGLCKAFGIASPSKKMKEIGGYIIDGLKEGIQNGISTIVSKCTELWNKVKNVFSNVGSWFKTTFQTAWTNVQNVFSNWGSFFSGLWNKISSTFSSLGTSIASAISGSVKNGINNVIGKIQNTINSAIGVINRAIAVMNAIPGVHANSISTISLPRLARGAIVNNPGRGVPAIIGEAGREAVLPLEQNTEWMDILAEKIGGGGNVTIPIYLDNRKIAEYVVDTQKRRAFALNGGY